MQKPQFLIGAASSGSGKTTLSLGLLRALRNRGLRVQPFKCGPDYLDTKHHAAAAGTESYNLDAFMSSTKHVREVYARRGKDADICLVEGVMGLFDGYDRMRGSSAEIAETLNLPVVLVANARSTAYSVAALLYGFKHFRPTLRIAGVVFNFVGSETHYGYLRQACQDAGVEAIGYLPKCKEIEIPSRHLGLSIDSAFCFDEFADRIARQVEQTVDIGRLLEICRGPIPERPVNEKRRAGRNSLRIAVARDEAFNFCYPENLRALEQQGDIAFFSPLDDDKMPPADFVYLPGGYPELYLPRLSANRPMQQSVRDYCHGGGRMLAECGGMMYLGESVVHTDGQEYPLCGVLPLSTSMENMKLTLGYRKISFGGHKFRGHEFHYSRIRSGAERMPSIATASNAKDIPTDAAVFRSRNVVASYIHFYWAETFPLFFNALFGQNPVSTSD